VNEPRRRHSVERDGIRRTWYVDRLWTLAHDLETESVPIESIAAVDQNVWFWDGHAPTVRNITARIRRIEEADLAYPIILNANGDVMDGAHRLARALHEGLHEVVVVRFAEEPPPDVEEPASRATDNASEAEQGRDPLVS
jgi:hypothetical protein